MFFFFLNVERLSLVVGKCQPMKHVIFRPPSHHHLPLTSKPLFTIFIAMPIHSMSSLYDYLLTCMKFGQRALSSKQTLG